MRGIHRRIDARCCGRRRMGRHTRKGVTVEGRLPERKGVEADERRTDEDYGSQSVVVVVVGWLDSVNKKNDGPRNWCGR